MTAIKAKKIERLCNAIELIGVTIILLLALVIQFILHDNPCPLCLLQRVGLFCVALGFLMNLRFSPHPRHYAIIILSGLFTAFVALRHIAINLSNPEGGFGSPIFGWHLYTWSFMFALAIVIGSALVMCIDRAYLPVQKNTKVKGTVKIMLLTTILLLVINIGIVLQL